MIIITVSRKPVEGTVSSNVLKYGCGGLNIGGCRIPTACWDAEAMERVNSPGSGRNYGYTARQTNGGQWDGPIGTGTMDTTKGRWPANLILSHLPGCKKVGVKEIKNPCGSVSGKEPSRAGGENTTCYGEYERVPFNRYGGKEGTEVVEAWECAKGCPVAALDGQSGFLHPSGNKGDKAQGDLPYNASSYHMGYKGRALRDCMDEGGGASRFFKAIQEKDMTKIPQDLIEYLLTLISPPDGGAAYFASFDDLNFKSYEDASVCGILVRGQPTEEQSKELLRILKPGAHLLLIAPDEQPTGHTGTCRIEDAGFEIRDSILWIREPGHFHYVAKAARAEREAGCEHLEGKTGAAAVDREENTAGLNSPRAGAGRTAEKVKNHHPTVKPVELMELLLADVPKGRGPVLDCFMGSGTTGIACLRTGHDFIGIEKEAEYLEIADARVRHWDRETQGGQVIRKIESDHKPKPKDDTPKSMDDFFGFGD